ncbi:GD16595 [Drosophila simulans]|uniref:GD16595 n=1 Tax=Drosophila simulans TaxID=7240 RepID=B4R3F6_DROSI|nr:GD16595 [Drosophila simulans]
MCFLRFLAQARGTLGRHLAEASPVAWAAAPDVSGRKLHLVMGNESCDLDSAVSAVTLAFVYAQRHREHDYVPILNIPRRDYPLKTEVGHLFVKCGLPSPCALPRRFSPGSGPGCERYSRGPPCKPAGPKCY